MPQLTIEGPDKKQHVIEVPEGTSDEDAMRFVKKEFYPPTNTQPGLIGKPATGGPTDVKSSPGRDMAYRAVYGMARGLTGIPQAILDVGSFLGVPGAKSANQTITQNVENFGKTLPPAGWGGSIAQGAGELLPSLIGAPASLPGMVARGALAGATQFEPPGSTSDRLFTRGVESAVSAGTAGVIGAIGKTVTKAMNARQLGKEMQTARQEYANADPVITDKRGKIIGELDKITDRYAELNKQEIEIGNRSGAINLANLKPQVRTSLAAGQRVVNPDAKGLKVLEDVNHLYGDNQTWPNVLKGKKGETFALQPDGSYKSPSGIPLDNARRVKAFKQLGVSPLREARYGDLKATIQEVDSYLDSAKTTDSGVPKIVKELRQKLQDTLDAGTSPTAKQAARRADQFYAKNISMLGQDEELRNFFTETNPRTRADLAKDFALGDDVDKAKTVAKAIGPRGVEATKQAIFRDAIKESADKGGYIDPVKFKSFFDNRPAIAPFMDAEANRQVKGIQNLLSDNALKRQEGVKPSFGHHSYVPFFGMFMTGERLASGDLPGAAKAAAGTAFMSGTIRGIDSLLSSSFGRNLISAAGRARPGSPRMARIAEAVSRRLASPAPAAAEEEWKEP